MNPKTPVSEMTIKQRKWVTKYLETGNATEAAAQVYDCKNRDVARAIGHENLSKLSFEELMEEGGLTDAKLFKKLEEGLNAANFVKVPSEQPGREYEYGFMPDFKTRQGYLSTALELKKRLNVPKDLMISGTITLVFDPTLQQDEPDNSTLPSTS